MDEHTEELHDGAVGYGVIYGLLPISLKGTTLLVIPYADLMTIVSGVLGFHGEMQA
jgi:hypothetical protein